ncbi:hypothetical protein [Desulfosporosinus sp. SB140]|uniref:hypothetical protein n=1 Tax=Desulfosporosinus paludis TaxID=3115649 RepID=UPI00388EBC0C
MYDKEQIYDEQIAPLMTKIIEICQVNDIQMLASYFLKDKTEDEEDMLCTTCLLPAENRNKTLFIKNAKNRRGEKGGY